MFPESPVSILVLAFLVIAAAACAGQAPAPGERPPAVAGRFYPDSAASLRAMVRGFLDAGVPPLGPRPIALVAPHAGYVYSGKIAGDAWRQAEGQAVDTVVILGTNHTVPPFDGVSVFGGEGYRTPLGLARTDREVVRALHDADTAWRWRAAAHAEEHSEEVQVPFAQVAYPEAKIVTAVVGRPDPALCARFGRDLARALRGKNALIVASSDLSHYPAYEDAVASDRRTLEAMATLDPEVFERAIEEGMRKGVRNLRTCACGEAPILAALSAARALGATRGRIVSYANSGDVPSGDRSRVVGYGAVLFAAEPGREGKKGGGPSPEPGEDGGNGSGPAGAGRKVRKAEGSPAPRPDAPAAAHGPAAALAEASRSALLRIARATIEHYLATGKLLAVPGNLPDEVLRRQGAFVTLRRSGQLRGCIGHMQEDLPLAEAVRNVAVDAAVHDPRFRPVRAEEMTEIALEISVLTPAAPVPGPEAIVVGRDGVLLHREGRRAVFLPQVAAEQGWDRDTMLDHLCMKAGLPADCWREGADFETFQAIVFGEPERG